ncbi:MAG: hypothetical protein LBR45_01255 [Bacteroidales bacterium]|jgi:hypothetical protein|nr:hypothetical protein [Bacteroidales bacterium]
MMNKAQAEVILEFMENEMSSKGALTFRAVRELEIAVGEKYVDYLYPDGHTVLFNSKRFKRHFIENAIENA